MACVLGGRGGRLVVFRGVEGGRRAGGYDPMFWSSMYV